MHPCRSSKRKNILVSLVYICRMQALPPSFTRHQPPIPLATSSKHSGFTAIELLVVISILGILAALAGPSFTSTIQRWRVRQAVENMTSTIYYARSEAIKRGGRITVIRNDLTTECPQATTNQEWSCGWSVFVDSNDNGTQQANEETLQTFATPSRINVMNSATTAQTRFKVDRWGQINGLGAQGFTFSPVGPGVSSPYTTTLCVSSGGRLQANPGDASC